MNSNVAWSWVASVEVHQAGFSGLGWGPSNGEDERLQGYGWLNLWPDSVMQRAGGVAALESSGLLAATPLSSTPPEIWLVETLNGPIATVEQLNLLDRLVEESRTPRSWRVSHRGFDEIDRSSFASRDALLSVEACDLVEGPPWPHPDWMADAPWGPGMHRTQLNERAKHWQGPDYRPTIEWWERTEPSRLPPSPPVPPLEPQDQE